MKVLTLTLEYPTDRVCESIPLTGFNPDQWYEVRFIKAENLYCPGLIEKADSSGRLTLYFYRLKLVPEQKVNLGITEVPEWVEIREINVKYPIETIAEGSTSSFASRCSVDMIGRNDGKIQSSQLSFHFKDHKNACNIRGMIVEKNFDYLTFQFYCMNERLEDGKEFSNGDVLEFSIRFSMKTKREIPKFTGDLLVRELVLSDSHCSSMVFSDFEPNSYYSIEGADIQFCRKWCKSDDKGRISIPCFVPSICKIGPQISRKFVFYKLEREPILTIEYPVSTPDDMYYSGANILVMVYSDRMIFAAHPEEFFIDQRVSIEARLIAYDEEIYCYSLNVQFNGPTRVPDKTMKILAYSPTKVATK